MDWGTVGRPDLKADGTADIETDCGGTGRAVIGREEGTVNDIVRRKIHRRVGFNRLGQTASQHISRKQRMKGELTASERRLASSRLPIAGLRTRLSPMEVES